MRSENQKLFAIDLKRQGQTYNQIGQTLGITKDAARNLINEKDL